MQETTGRTTFFSFCQFAVCGLSFLSLIEHASAGASTAAYTPYDKIGEAAGWRVALVIYMIIMGGGIVLEVACLVAVRRLPSLTYRLQFSFFLVLGLLWFVMCLIQCLVNLIGGKMMGDYVGCAIHANGVITLIFGMAMTIGIWSWSLRCNIVTKPLTNKRLLVYMCSSVFFYFGWGLLGTLGPTEARLMNSGTSCLLDTWDWYGVIWLIVGVMPASSLVGFSFWGIIIEIKRCEKLLRDAVTSQGRHATVDFSKVVAKSAYQDDAKLIASFAGAINCALLPYMSSLLYGWTTHEWMPGEADVVIYVFVHFAPLVVVILSLLVGRSSEELRRETKNVLLGAFPCRMCKKHTYKIAAEEQIACDNARTGPCQGEIFFSKEGPERSQFAEQLLLQRATYDLLLDAAAASFSQENILCWLDLSVHKRATKQLLETCGDAEGEAFINELEECKQRAEHCVRMYFNDNFSPLQVNVSQHCVRTLRTSLNLPETAEMEVDMKIPQDLGGLMKLNVAFDVVAKEVLSLVTNNTIAPLLRKHPSALDDVVDKQDVENKVEVDTVSQRSREADFSKSSIVSVSASPASQHSLLSPVQSESKRTLIPPFLPVVQESKEEQAVDDTET